MAAAADIYIFKPLEGAGSFLRWQYDKGRCRLRACRHFRLKDMPPPSNLDRRAVLAAFASAAAIGLPSVARTQAGAPITRKIPSSGEAIPAVGLGTWITFNVGNDPVARDACAQVMRVFFAAGGRMIDSSPMYGSSQDVIGYGLRKLGKPDPLFSADKVGAHAHVPDHARVLPALVKRQLMARSTLREWISATPVRQR